MAQAEPSRADRGPKPTGKVRDSRQLDLLKLADRLAREERAARRKHPKKARA